MRTARPLLIFFVVLLSLGLAADTFAAPKDIDGKRTRARRTAVGAAVKDKLGPGDGADWRYVRVEANGKLTVNVEFQPEGNAVGLKVTDAKGKVIGQAEDKGKGARKLTVPVTPGIYYIEVSSDDKTSYTLDTSLG